MYELGCLQYALSRVPQNKETNVKKIWDLLLPLGQGFFGLSPDLPCASTQWSWQCGDQRGN